MIQNTDLELYNANQTYTVCLYITNDIYYMMAVRCENRQKEITKMKNKIAEMRKIVDGKIFQLNTRHDDGTEYASRHDLMTCIRFAKQFINADDYRWISINPVGQIGDDTALLNYDANDVLEIWVALSEWFEKHTGHDDLADFIFHG